MREFAPKAAEMVVKGGCGQRGFVLRRGGLFVVLLSAAACIRGGYDTHEPAPSAAISPVSGSWLNGQSAIEITFSASILPSSLVLTGSLVEVATTLTWESASQSNDQVIVKPETSWPDGPQLSIKVEAADASGRTVAPASATYGVDATAPLVNLSPPDGTPIEALRPLVVTFSESMRTSDTLLGGSMITASENPVWSATLVTNDTLIFTPLIEWSEEPITLTGSFEDLSGNQVNLDVSFPRGWRRMFVTSVSGSGDLSSWPDAGGATGLAAGDAICQARAEVGRLYGNFAAWLSDATTDAFCHVQGLSGKKASHCGLPAPPALAGPWVRTDGSPFAETIDLLLQRQIYTAVSFDESGVDLPEQTRFYTGTSAQGEAHPPNLCNDWTDANIDVYGTNGVNDFTGDFWTNGGFGSCSIEWSLACFELGLGPGLSLWAPVGKRVFLSSVGGSGDLGSWPLAGSNTGVAAGDAVCRQLASDAGLANPTTFRAWLSDSTEDATDRLASDGPWIRTDGVPVAASKADLLDGELFTGIAVTEEGNYLPPAMVWTGTFDDGTKTVENCSDWTTASAAVRGYPGRPASSVASWSDQLLTGETSPCDSAYRLYCFEDQ